MKRVLAVVLIAALTTLMLGIDRTSWANQVADQKKGDKQSAAVARSLRDMHRGTTARLVLKDGREADVVIEEITADTVTVMRQEGDHVVTETIQIADIARIKKVSLKKMGTASKVLIGVAVGVGVLFVAALAACASASSGDAPGTMAEATR
jgi:hypothetical protein